MAAEEEEEEEQGRTGGRRARRWPTPPAGKATGAGYGLAGYRSASRGRPPTPWSVSKEPWPTGVGALKEHGARWGY